MKLIARIDLKNVFVCFSLFVFATTFVSYNIHQLEHINDIVCTSADKHIHSSEDEDICKDLGYFNFYDFKSSQLKVFLNFCKFKFVNAEDAPVIGNFYDTPVRGPPSCSIVL